MFDNSVSASAAAADEDREDDVVDDVCSKRFNKFGHQGLRL